jgi:hypothetical protein
MLMSRFGYSLFPVIILSIAADICNAVDIRPIGTFSLEPNARVYGKSDGNIIIATENQIIFLDDNRLVQSRIELDSTQVPAVSSNGNFYAIVESDPEGEADSSGKIITVYDRDQRPLWSTYGLAEGDYYLSPAGDYVAVVTGTPRHYDFRLFIYPRDKPPARVDIESFESLVFSHDGQKLLVDAGRKGVKLIDAYGSLIHEFASHRKVAFSAGDELIAVFSHKGVLRIFENGQEKLSVNLRHHSPQEMVLREDIGRAAVVFKGRLNVVDLDDGSIIWQDVPIDNFGFFSSVDISPDGRFIACGVYLDGQTRPDKASGMANRGQLYLFDINGAPLKLMNFGYDRYSPGLPDVRFMPDGKSIVVETAETLHFYEMFRF